MIHTIIRSFILFKFFFLLVYRKDLAKIVRKRGYKAVAQLLRSQANADDIQTEENLVENQDSLDSKTEKSSGLKYFNFFYEVKVHINRKTSGN